MRGPAMCCRRSVEEEMYRKRAEEKWPGASQANQVRKEGVGKHASSVQRLEEEGPKEDKKFSQIIHNI